MIRKTEIALAFLLAVSLGFSVFFAVGYFSAKADLGRAGTPAGRVKLAENALRLTAGQREAFRRLRAGLSDDAREIKDENCGAVESFWREILEDRPDPAVIENALSRAAQARCEFAARAAARMREFLGLLDRDQRRACAILLRKYVLPSEIR